MPLENQLENQVQIDTPNTPITEQIVAVRDAWHTKKHPLFQDMAAGSYLLSELMSPDPRVAFDRDGPILRVNDIPQSSAL